MHSFNGGFMKLLVLCFAFLLASIQTLQAAPDFGEKVKQSMASLKERCTKLGAPKVEGETTVAGKKVPVLYFGATKMNDDFTIVDALKNEMGGTATLFVKAGSEYVRVTTNVQKEDGQRALGTILDPAGKAIANINKGEAFFGEVDILGKMYTTGYEPIKDATGKTIGVFYVGYLKL